MEIELQPVGSIPAHLLEALSAGLTSIFGCPSTARNSMPVPPVAYLSARNQFSADLIIDSLGQPRKESNRLVGIVDLDIYTGLKPYVIGLAAAERRVAVVSLFYLKQEHYGLPEDQELLAGRTLKETVHEVGHTFGLEHCHHNGYCVMCFSGSIMDTDIKSFHFCNDCQPRLMI